MVSVPFFTILLKFFPKICGSIVHPHNEKYLSDSSGFYAVISGFVPEQIPCVGCLYQFIDRLMKLPKYCKANQIRFKRKRLSKKKKQQADKQKVTKRHVGIVAKLAKRFARIETGEKPVYLPKAEAMAFAILETCCLNESHRLRLLDKNHLFVAGDSTKLKVDGNRYGKKVCHCYQKSCDCKRHYNAKEPTIGYDAHRDAFIYSHSLYQLNSCSTFHTAELPAYLMMTEGARHDSVTASFPMHRATQRLGIDAACFDAAHDATAFYQMAHDRWRTQVFIPLNTTNEGNYQQIPMEKISQQGIPICREGHDMYFSGYCKDRDRVKWHRPDIVADNPLLQ